MTIWEDQSFEPGVTRGVQVGPLQIWIKRETREWLLGRSYETDPDNVPGLGLIDGQAPDDIEYERWAASAQDKQIRLKPALPDRPLVAMTDAPLFVPPNYQTTVYVSMPLWVRLETGQPLKPVVLTEMPCILNSSTWYGDPVAGELCYSLRTRARTEVPEGKQDLHRVLARLTIENATDAEALEFQRVCIRAPDLRVYQQQDTFWTNDVHMTTRGVGKPDVLRYSEGAPTEASESILLSQPRAQNKGGMIKGGIADFKSWVSR